MDPVANLLNGTDGSVVDDDNATTSTIITTTISTTISSTISTSTSNTLITTTTSSPEDSHSLFFFCTIMFFVGIAVVAKIIYSNRNRYSVLNINPNWRLSASRASGSGAFSNVPTDPFNPDNRPGGLGFGSAHYTAVTPSSGEHLAQAHEEWERQFFDEQPSEQERVSSRLELRR